MNASILDLRYKTKAILKALEKSEKVNILYHGKIKGIISPLLDTQKSIKVKNHEFFGSLKREKKSVLSTIQQLRGGRYRDL